MKPTSRKNGSFGRPLRNSAAPGATSAGARAAGLQDVVEADTLGLVGDVLKSGEHGTVTGAAQCV
jgi:hypothetical protein